MQQYLQNKKGLVQGVFDKVYNKYDIMNDLMSLGVHRIWKRNLINVVPIDCKEFDNLSPSFSFTKEISFFENDKDNK